MAVVGGALVAPSDVSSTDVGTTSAEIMTRPAGLVLLVALNLGDVFSTGKAMAAGGH